MKIKLRSKNFDITPAIDEYVSKKISTLEKFLDTKNESLCEVEIGRTTKHHNTGDIFKAEVNIVQPGNKQIYAVAEEIDGHYVLFHGSSSGGSSVFGVSRERNDADKRLRDRLLGRVNYANFWSRGIKYTLEDRTQQCTTD